MQGRDKLGTERDATGAGILGCNCAEGGPSKLATSSVVASASTFTFSETSSFALNV
jgi:hypothetical protein